MRGLAVLLLALFLVPGLARAQEGSAERAGYDHAYNAMIRSSHAMPGDFDFVRLRALYSHTSFYQSHAVSPEHDFPVFFSRLKKGDDSVVDEVRAYSAQNAALFDTNVYAASFFRKTGRETLAAYHDWMTQGLLRAMIKDGDASARDKAMKVLALPREYAAVARGGRKVVAKRIDRKQNGRPLRVLTVRGDDGTQEDLWFELVKILPLETD